VTKAIIVKKNILSYSLRLLKAQMGVRASDYTFYGYMKEVSAKGNNSKVVAIELSEYAT
jgi:hypothetical protein